MEPGVLIDGLRNREAYQFPVADVEVRQTHISVVFLAGAFAYKVKKPVEFGFLDFSTLDKRRHFCEEEVRLNRRLAPDVYLGVVPITREGTRLRVEGTGEVVEWAVKMQRLPDEAALDARLERGEVDANLAGELARRIAAFHRTAARSESIATFGRFEAVARNLRDIYTQSKPQVGTTVSETVFERLQELTEESLTRLRPVIDARGQRGMTRDCHGDLHLDHVYYFPNRPAPGDLVIVDCIEFTERFRYIDPVADMAFPVMDFAFHGRRDLGRVFADAYFQAADDDEGRALLPLYGAYRGTVRGSVTGLKLAEKEVPSAERRVDLQQARGHWLVALDLLEVPDRRPCLLLVGGLPGTGKSSLCRWLAERAGFSVIRSDVVRKEPGGIPEKVKDFGPGAVMLYSREWTDATYAECLRRAEGLLFQGQRVIVDATFREDRQREQFLEAARKWGVPGGVLLCQASPETCRRRLALRTGDASDADWSVYKAMAGQWEVPGPETQAWVRVIDTESTLDQAGTQACTALWEWELLARIPKATESPAR
jgi:aminoglycoside phosphotransferase family enzyme/predicted kinase